jgi:hypothetical protein
VPRRTILRGLTAPASKGMLEMNETFEELGKYGKDFAESGLNSIASLSKGVQAIATEASDYASKSFEAGGTVAAKLLSAKSLEDAVEIQSQYLKRCYEGFVAEATTMGNLYADLARDAYKPFEAVVAKEK